MKIAIEQAKKILTSGGVIAIPTETVYGLAAWLFDEKAIRQIFSLKGRPAHNPLILHIGKKEECLRFCPVLPAGFNELTDAFWPGPLTLVLPIDSATIPAVARANLPTAAFRMPKHSYTLELLQSVSPLVAPSANKSGSPSSTRPEHIEHDFGADFPILDGDQCEHGLESTILVSNEGKWQIARLGALTAETIASVLGYHPLIADKNEAHPICPGQLLQHYAPKARLVLSKEAYNNCPQKLPYVLGFDNESYRGATKVYSLGSKNDPQLVSYRLYDLLRQLDDDNVTEVWVDIALPKQGLWEAIFERLSRAASR